MDNIKFRFQRNCRSLCYNQYHQLTIFKMADNVTNEVLKKYFPGGYFGFDRDGRPVFIEPLGTVDFVGLLHSVKEEDIVNFKRKRCEEAKQMCEEQENKLGKSLKRYSTLVLDAEGGSRKHLWKPGINLYLAIIKMYEEEYPNLRERILIIKAPVIFPIIYSVMRPLFDQKTKDKVKILGSNWKEELQEYISPNNLPEYYGGTCQDQNGSPKCEQSISYGGEVPESYYLTKNVNKDDFEEIKIKAGKKAHVSQKVINQSSKIIYQFISSENNIGFSVEHVLDDGDNEIIIPMSTKSSHRILQEGIIDCEKAGEYLFIFDNSDSWIRGKHVYYMIKIEEEE